MNNFRRALRHEIKESIFPILFFLAVFHLVALSKVLLLETYSVTLMGASIATVMAFTVAKAILIMDRLSISDTFSNRPRIWNIVWRTLLFTAVTGVFRFAEELIVLVLEHNGLASALERLAEEVSWPLFVAMQMWLFIALFLFNTIVAFDRHFGVGSVRRTFLG